jgi:hypothetical protein
MTGLIGCTGCNGWSGIVPGCPLHAPDVIDAPNVIVVDRGDWMQTFSGGRWYPQSPRPEDVRIEDIAHALANTCRYAGHSERFYSVAEHCILICAAMNRDGQSVERQLAGLMHDAAEAYLCDIPRPLKPLLTNYLEMERIHEFVIQDALGLAFAGHAPETKDFLGTKFYDNHILYDESKALFTSPNAHWHDKYAPGLGVTIRGLTPKQAEDIFLEMYHARIDKARVAVGGDENRA